MTQQRYIAHFQPVDAQGEQEWDCTSFFTELSKGHLDPVEVEETIAEEGVWLDVADDFKEDPGAPGWIREHSGPFDITLRYRTDKDAGIPQELGSEPPKPTIEKLLTAIESHRIEVYSQAPPNFCWDIELYRAAGLLPEDYVHPEEDQLNGSVYAMRKALEALIAGAEPVATKLAAGAYVHYMDAKRLANEVAAAKQALAEHSTAKACSCSVHGND